MKDKNDTVSVFEIMRALDGRSMHRGYARLIRLARGRHLAEQRLELAPWLDRSARLETWQADTVGATYRQFHLQSGFTAQGRVQVSRIGANDGEDDQDPLAWHGRHVRDTRDL